MGQNMYEKAKKFIENLAKNRKNRQISFDILLSELKKQIGADYNRTVKPYIALMKETGLIKQIKKTNKVRLGGKNDVR